jgi:hypothetical protein
MYQQKIALENVYQLCDEDLSRQSRNNSMIKYQVNK